MEVNDPPRADAGPGAQQVTIRRMIQLFRISSPTLRSKLALQAGRYFEYRTFIEKKITDADPRVRANLVESLWGINNASARYILRRAAEDPHSRVRCNALLGLYLLGDTAAIEALVALGRHPGRVFRASAAWAMGETQDVRFQKMLEEMKSDPEPTVRSRAEIALATLTGKRAD